MESADGAPSDVSSVNGGNAEKDATLAVKVALNIRPLIGLERIQGCKDCITVVPGEPQVQIGSHSFTFDHVYGGTSKSMSLIFEECVAPLVEGLFHGYNATVLAYGQTGSGKTYTMGTGYTVGGSTEGVIPQVMDTIFHRVDSLREKVDFQIRVSFIEIHKEEVHDLLDPAPPATVKAELANAGGFGSGSSKNLVGGKAPIQIRETINGGITLAGVTETDVASQSEMAVCLEQGSLCRATGSTMMNTRSSRSHAIFTITLEQRRKWEMPLDGSSIIFEDAGEDYLCAKLHLVDLAGSERAKRTGADGVRFKEGVHINKGLLALGNVISALGDEKKRKEGGHVPYRDSKLTRLLQDSLGGNSRTVMIACVSPADSNAEETLNTLKYANRARNIQNKPTVNRDPTAAEIQRLRQQVELMQAELLCARAGSAPEEVQLLKEKIAWLEVSNNDLRKELKETRSQIEGLSGKASEARLDRDKLQLRLEQLRSGKSFEELDGEGDPEGESLLKRIQDLEEQLQRAQVSGGTASRPVLNSISLGDLDSTSRVLDFPGIPNGEAALPLASATGAGDPEASAMEVEHAQLQENLDRELQELNKRLEQKEAEMKSFLRPDAVVLKQHFEKKLVELEEEKNNLQRERDRLHNELATLTSTTDEQSHKMHETSKKIKDLETQIADLKKKEENQSQQLKAKQRADEAAKRLQEEIHRIKSQKVQLQQKIKSESEQYRLWKAAREKEVLQLRKEGRRTEYEMHKLQGLHQRQKLVLQRKTEEAAAATRRLKELLAKAPRESGQGASSMGNYSQNHEKSLQAMLDQELEMAVRTHEVRLAYEKQMEIRAEWAKELQSLREEEELLQSSTNPTPSMSPGARSARMRLLETMIKNSSDNMVNMASQLSEAEERDRVYGGRMRWHQLRTMGDAKSLLQMAFEAAASAKCRLGEIEAEHKEFKEKSAELEQLLRQSEAHRKELEMSWVNENKRVSSLTTVTPAGLDAGMKEGMSEESKEGAVSARSQAPNSKARSKTLLEQMQSDQAGGSNDGHHYITRKAGRGGIASTRNAQYMESYSSEGELDMDTEQSDEEWHEDLEKQAVRRTKALGGFRLSSRQKSMSLDKSGRSGSNQGLHSQEQEPPFGSIISRSSSGETVLEDNQDKERERLSTFSCSCGRSSGCKTSKCECKAAGGFCGSGCGCKAGKCNNREAVEVEEGSSSLASSLQMEMAETLAAVGVDQADRRFYDSGEAGKLLSSGLEGGDHPTKRAERLLIVHGATLLESAWKEEVQNAETQEEVDSRELGQDLVEEVASKKQQRRVLKDIGNTKGNGRGRASGKHKKVQVIQLMVQPERPPNTAAAPPVAAAATPAATPSQVPPNLAAPLPEIVSPLWRQQSLQRRSSTAQLSPLRLRANKVGGSKSGVGSSNDESGAGKNPKAGNGSGSPARPARQTDEKENIHRNSFV
ncbi:hypothetical protein R1sor_002406 [Riccia sorocarpa]|uniref:Kinesin motor domain-containing protein n=1 Tax=Riccia sorocarpa TaxID=122646 RepID=A0ABD3H2P8_9MARC